MWPSSSFCLSCSSVGAAAAKGAASDHKITSIFALCKHSATNGLMFACLPCICRPWVKVAAAASTAEVEEEVDEEVGGMARHALGAGSSRPPHAGRGGSDLLPTFI